MKKHLYLLATVTMLGVTVMPVGNSIVSASEIQTSVSQQSETTNITVEQLLTQGETLGNQLSDSGVLAFDGTRLTFDSNRALAMGIDSEVVNELNKIAMTYGRQRGKCGFVFHCGPQARGMSRVALIAACEAAAAGGLAALSTLSPAATVAVGAALAVVVGAAVGAKTINVMVDVPLVSWKKDIYLP
jgi:hypothetical protein